MLKLHSRCGFHTDKVKSSWGLMNVGQIFRTMSSDRQLKMLFLSPRTLLVAEHTCSGYVPSEEIKIPKFLSHSACLRQILHILIVLILQLALHHHFIQIDRAVFFAQSESCDVFDSEPIWAFFKLKFLFCYLISCISLLKYQFMCISVSLIWAYLKAGLFFRIISINRMQMTF